MKITKATLSFVIAVFLAVAPVTAVHADGWEDYNVGFDSGSYGYNDYNAGFDSGSYGFSDYNVGFDSGSYGYGYEDYNVGFDSGSYGNGYEDTTYGTGTEDGTYGSGTEDGTYGTGYEDTTYGSGYEDCGSSCYTSQTYTSQTPYYSSGCNCYASSPNYSTQTAQTYRASSMPSYAYEAIPSSARSYVPSYVYQPSYTAPSRPQPTYSVSTTPAPTYNTNTNTNVNTPTAVATATATNGDNVNTNVASTGAITNTNTFAPVINVQSGGTQRPVQHEFPRPVCTIYATAGHNQVTLTWTSQNATTAYISPNVGNVPVNGSRQVYSQGYTTYTLTVTGSGGSATCQTAANYAPSYTVAPTYPTAPAPYVSLSQIPYTGFDYGPVGNAIYWTAILAFAAAAGYLLVYGMPAFAFAGFGRKQENAFADASVQEVFKSNLVTSNEVVTEEKNDNTFDLPVATSSQAGLTSDAMILDRSSGTPRIVIARA